MSETGHGPTTAHQDSPVFRAVRPPQPVWINLAAVYPLREKPPQIFPHGLDLQATVPGRLHLWAMTTTGQWVGWVIYEAPSLRGASGWIFAHALEPRLDHTARKDSR
ncbi:MAG TPA: hypothetical protein VHX38_35680 [Pseudonocardiaceae bacterium]|nr:hypothetical protein [Pseudonocardiaceae bacterium]